MVPIFSPPVRRTGVPSTRSLAIKLWDWEAWDCEAEGWGACDWLCTVWVCIVASVSHVRKTRQPGQERALRLHRLEKVLGRALDSLRGRIFCGKPEVHFSGKCSL